MNELVVHFTKWPVRNGAACVVLGVMVAAHGCAYFDNNTAAEHHNTARASERPTCDSQADVYKHRRQKHKQQARHLPLLIRTASGWIVGVKGETAVTVGW